MPESSRYHSIKIDKGKCIGCVICMKVCPTKAIRVRGTKAKIIYERCVDCGECLRACPHNAVIPTTTSSADLDHYRYKVALPSPVLYSQYGQRIIPDEILCALKDIGFDEVHDDTLMCEMMSMAIEKYLDDHRDIRPEPFFLSECHCRVGIHVAIGQEYCVLRKMAQLPPVVRKQGFGKEAAIYHPDCRGALEFPVTPSHRLNPQR